jgi:hypothetical protein
MTKEKYMALADFQTLWDNKLKPWIVGNVLNNKFVFDENAQATATTPPSTTAGVSTLGKIYLVGPQAGTKYQWITEVDESTTPNTYSWHQIGTTDITISIASEQDVRDIVDDYFT